MKRRNHAFLLQINQQTVTFYKTSGLRLLVRSLCCLFSFYIRQKVRYRFNVFHLLYKGIRYITCIIHSYVTQTKRTTCIRNPNTYTLCFHRFKTQQTFISNSSSFLIQLHRKPCILVEVFHHKCLYTLSQWNIFLKHHTVHPSRRIKREFDISCSYPVFCSPVSIKIIIGQGRCHKISSTFI